MPIRHFQNDLKEANNNNFPIIDGFRLFSTLFSAFEDIFSKRKNKNHFGKKYGTSIKWVDTCEKSMF